MAIDKKQPNPMKSSDDIATFNKIKTRTKTTSVPKRDR